jgi:hypothetical protein
VTGTRLVESGLMREDTFAEPPVPTEGVPEPRPAVPDPLDAFPTEAEVEAAAKAAAAAEVARTSARWARPRRKTVAQLFVAGVSALVSAAATVARKARPRSRTALGLVVAGGAVVVAAVVWFWLPGVGDQVRRVVGLVMPATAATLVIETTPPGWEVVEGARNLGTTPFRGSLPPGRHALLLRSGSESRPLDVALTAGVEVFHHLDLQAASSTGGLSVATSPPGAAVQVDGVGRGISPVDVAGLAPGNHAVTVTVGTWTVTEQVAVAAGKTTTLLIPVAPPGPLAGAVGFVTIAAPIELQVFDGDSLVGSSRNQRIMVMPGRRALRVANPALGFERVIQVAVEAGATSKVTVPVPNGSLSVNAVPWAEVLIDGKVIGETPIANYAVPPGSHEIVLRNPKFPEQRRTVVVTLTAPLRVGVDLRQ